MAESLTLVEPSKLERNPDNPRLIFHQDELDALQESISSQGILVPLTVYREGNKYHILDGERRWRCSLKLGLPKVPIIIQPKPGHMQNIMMMFAIHNARKDWDPLPTAIKLEELDKIFTRQQGRRPTEKELAELASMSRGEVRRLRKLLALPKKYRTMLMKELEKPRSQQALTVDQVLEATKAAEALRKKEVIDKNEESLLREAIIEKFKNNTIINTVSPRQLVKVGRAVERGDITKSRANIITNKIITDPTYTIDDAFETAGKKSEFQHSTAQLIDRIQKTLETNIDRGYKPPDSIRSALRKLSATINQILKT